MKYPVADCGNLAGILNYAVLRILQSFHNQLDGGLMGRHVLLYHIFILTGCLVGQLGTGNTDSLAKSLCQYALIVHINQLIF